MRLILEVWRCLFMKCFTIILANFSPSSSNTARIQRFIAGFFSVYWHDSYFYGFANPSSEIIVAYHSRYLTWWHGYVCTPDLNEHACAHVTGQVSIRQTLARHWLMTDCLPSLIAIGYQQAAITCPALFDNQIRSVVRLEDPWEYHRCSPCRYTTWQRHGVETLSTALALCEGNPLAVNGGLPSRSYCFKSLTPGRFEWNFR